MVAFPPNSGELRPRASTAARPVLGSCTPLEARRDVDSAEIFSGLNPEQRRAVETTEGPLLVLAGAGSGKTRVLTHRIAYLIGALGIPSEQILAVTFTNKAAGEMRERVEKLLGPAARELWCGTFHSVCVRILRRDIGHLGFSRGFAIYDEADSLGLIKEAMQRHNIDPKVVEPRRLRWRIDACKNASISAAQAAASAHDPEARRAAEVFATYQRLLVEANALDFNDLLLRTTELFTRFPEVLRHYQQRWQYVLVDEYQDTNRVQYQLIQQVAATHRNLCVVGDPDQSIYAWRGADIRNILDFEKDYRDAQVVKLERNYRSTQPILTGATGVISNNQARKRKELFTERSGGKPIQLFEAEDDREEASFVVGKILTELEAGNRRRGDFAIFYRTNAQSRLFEEKLLEYDVPHVVVGGVRFYDRAEIKDALSYLRAVLNPQDAVSLRRVINRPARGIGKSTVERAGELATADGTPLLDALRKLAASSEGGRAAAALRRFLELYDELARAIPGTRPADAIARVLDRSGYLAALQEEKSPEAEGRIENLRELLAAAEDFDRANAAYANDDRSELELFLDQVALVSDLDSYDDKGDVVSMMTVHTAKGLEYPVVFLVGLEEGIFPHSASLRDEDGIEEERRLCYVGMTRAMEELTLTCAGQRFRFGQASYGIPSRFLNEIPGEVLSEARSRRRGPARDAEFGERRGGYGSSYGGGVSRQRSGRGESLDYSIAQAPAEEGSGIVPGLRVRHPVFGLGKVLQVSGRGADQKLRIQFERAGIKTVLLRFANLELG
jgi:DNA helicase-2/ATP-dependent DNA helicase PcrA